MPGALPTFVVIGAGKCGTTALHSYLARHPEVSMSNPKELRFFVAEERWNLGLEWYMSRFNPRRAVRGESSPAYTSHPIADGVPERMSTVIPDAKLIYIVRDPIERAHASYIHAYANRAESSPLSEAILDPAKVHLQCSRYHHQLSRFLEHYPLERILLLEQEELRQRRRETLRRVFEFVGAAPGHWHPGYEAGKLETATRRRRSRLGAYAARRLPPRHFRRLRDRRPFSWPFAHPPLPDEVRRRLEDALREDAEALRRLTGQRFEHWSV